MKLIVAIAAGGALGAVSRHMVAGYITRHLAGGFPLGTLTVNILGSFLMGLLVGLMIQYWTVSAELRAFLTVGFLGAFTTFSTFSMETVLLMERGALAQAALYVVASVACCVVGFLGGITLVRWVAA
ncbi:MAG: fluoride efflux transporter CrcB [Pseudomonadota bacterium]